MPELGSFELQIMRKTIQITAAAKSFQDRLPVLEACQQHPSGSRVFKYLSIVSHAETDL